MAPGQGDKFLEIMENLRQSEPVVPDDLILLHEAYQNTLAHCQKVLILSVIPSLLYYSKEYFLAIIKIF